MITLTDKGAEKVGEFLSAQASVAETAGLRVGVRGGGCSGLAYIIEWAEAPKERDKIFEKDGIRVYVDPKSYLYLLGSELRYEETLMASGFKLENPNVKAACGCGETFTV